jgi:hypothetical protein
MRLVELDKRMKMQTDNQAGEVVAEAQSKDALAAPSGSARVVQRGLKIVWGYNAAPKLPDNWRIERNPEAAALAVSPDGNEYLIGDGVLYPYLKCPPEGLPMSSLKPGQRYIDVVKAIKAPNVEVSHQRGG